MKILIDTNVLVSAALFPGSVPYQAYMKAVGTPFNALICDQNIKEFKRVFDLKFPHKVDVVDRFLSFAMVTVEVVSTPSSVALNEEKIRDIMDRPIFRAAVNFNVDIILTGDRDFLEAKIEKPKCLTPAEFLLI